MTRFGRAMLSRWRLDPDLTYLNHGTVGATPARVLDAQQELRDVIERQPAQFLLRETSGQSGVISSAPTRMRAAAARVAEFVGARSQDLVFVDNATAGANAVLRSFPFRAGDEILVTDHGYGAITNAARLVARERSATVRTVELPVPIGSPERVIQAIASGLGSATRLLIIDHVSSSSAIVFPVSEIVRQAHARGVLVLVDGAHAPGALPLDIASIGADWYTGNLHKWAWAPRSSAILWAAPEHQPGLHPPVISWGLDQGFTAEFDWVGTRDPSPWLAAPSGVDLMRELGLDAIRAHNHALVMHATRRLHDAVGADAMAPEAMTGQMVTLGLPPRYGSTPDAASRLRDALLFEDRIEVPVQPWANRLWIRVSGQIYNDESDVERLAEALIRRGVG